MNESLLETANLYVLGHLTMDAAAAFEHELKQNPALQKEVQALQLAVLALAHSAPQIAPPADLRAQLLAGFPGMEATAPPAKPQTARTSQTTKPAPVSPGMKVLHFIPWAAAAAIAVLFYQNKNAISQAQRQTTAAQAETASAREREKSFLEAIRLSESAKARSESALTSLRSKLTQIEAALAALSQEKETLVAELSILRDNSQLDKTRIAVLGSLLKNHPGAVAVSLWRQESQDGLLVVENLPALPVGRDYQLWVIDPNLKTPVSAGVFKVDAEGKVRIEFKPNRAVQSAYKFAVTIEKEGGAVEPTLDKMVVIGG